MRLLLMKFVVFESDVLLDNNTIAQFLQ